MNYLIGHQTFVAYGDRQSHVVSDIPTSSQAVADYRLWQHTTMLMENAYLITYDYNQQNIFKFLHKVKIELDVSIKISTLKVVQIRCGNIVLKCQLFNQYLTMLPHCSPPFWVIHLQIFQNTVLIFETGFLQINWLYHQELKNHTRLKFFHLWVIYFSLFEWWYLQSF